MSLLETVEIGDPVILLLLFLNLPISSFFNNKAFINMNCNFVHESGLLSISSLIFFYFLAPSSISCCFFYMTLLLNFPHLF